MGRWIFRGKVCWRLIKLGNSQFDQAWNCFCLLMRVVVIRFLLGEYVLFQVCSSGGDIGS